MGALVNVVVAVDGGGSKTEVVVADTSGSVLAQHRGPGCSHHALGVPRAVEIIDEAVRQGLRRAGAAAADVVSAGCYLTAIDLDSEQEAVQAALAPYPWTARLVVDNDVFALLRAGTAEPDAAVVVCGTGINGAAVRADGATARVLSLGHLSGDWGGGSGIAEEVLWFAARAEDGRGEPTALRDALLSWTGRRSVHDVITDVHLGRLEVASWWSRVPEVFRLAREGDGVARHLVERQGLEIGALAGALLTQLGLESHDVPVVLGGGMVSSGEPLLLDAVHEELVRRAPRARAVVCRRPPVDGALALVLDSLPL